MAIITVVGDETKFTLRAKDEEWGSTYIVTNGTELSNSEYTFTLTLQDNVELILAYYVDDWLQEIEFTDKFKYQITGNTKIVIDVQDTKPERDVSGFNKLYKVDKEILKSLSQERFQLMNSVDLAEYIINIIELPFTLHGDILGDVLPIRLGNHQLETNATEIIYDLIVFNMGTIKIPEKYGNIFDYVNVDVKLHLPFTDSISLDVEYVVGCELKIEYVIDLYFGDVTVNIFSSRTSTIVESKQMKIGRNIPFIRNNGGSIVNQLSSAGNIFNGVLTPYVEISRNRISNTDNIFSNTTLVYGTLRDYEGFVSVENMLLDVEAPANEKDEIMSLLQQGVFINK